MEAKEIAIIIDRINAKTNRYYIEGEGRFSSEDIEMIALHRQFAILEAGRIEGIREVVEDFETVLDAPVGYQRAMFFDVLNEWQEQLKEKGIEQTKGGTGIIEPWETRTPDTLIKSQVLYNFPPK